MTAERDAGTLAGSENDGLVGHVRLPDGKPILSRLVALNGPAADDVRVVRSVAAFDRELETARAENKPVMLDFSADWCVECRLMDAVLRKPELNRPLQDFRVVRADVTAVDADSRALMERFDVVGPPTILLFGPQALLLLENPDLLGRGRGGCLRLLLAQAPCLCGGVGGSLRKCRPGLLLARMFGNGLPRAPDP